jgi:hypothetical protein
MEYSRPKVYICLASQEISTPLPPLRSQEVHYRVYKSPQLVLLSQINPVDKKYGSRL